MSHDRELPIRPLRLDDDLDVARWATLTSRVFHAPRPTEAGLASRRERVADQRVSVVEDDGELVAGFRAFGTTVSLPGGALVPAAAVSGVVVQPTHKRRGLLTRWLTAELRDARERGDALAALYASEAGIYGRFGFGPATAAARWTLDVGGLRFHTPPAGRVRAVEADALRGVVDSLYAAAQRRSPGSIARQPHLWTTLLGVTDLVDDSRSRWHAVHLGDDGEPDGFITYVLVGEWLGGRPRSRLEVRDLVAATDAAEHALLHHACHVDLVASVEVEQAPGWAGRHLVTDPRRVSADRLVDGLWLRPLDVPVLLTSRSYGVDATLVLDVTDPLGLAGGRWRLTVDRGAAGCVATSERPDVSLGVAALASLLLGGDAGVPSLAALARSGRAAAEPAAVARADALFATPTAPYGLTFF